MSLSRRSLRTNSFAAANSGDSARLRLVVPALTTLAGTTIAAPEPAGEPPVGPAGPAEPLGVAELPAGVTAAAPPAAAGAAGAPSPGGGSIIAGA
ncbi:hypothetical protein [Mycobacterium pseudoshottsii]|uniref:hypothetical protein n=1 Tax=Mycobacterium pseudoshottsii TaxID=265949 RepID=UPI001F221B8A|nr:hypothetical protein [Mycobacterium pseudoshottsii]